MKQLLLYCRSGFEKECAAEIQDKAGQFGVFGYCKLKANDAFIIFEAYDGAALERFFSDFPFSKLIFVRQWALVIGDWLELPAGDRVTPVLETLRSVEEGNEISSIGELRIEYPDTNDGKELSTLARKLTVPLRQSLRQAGLMLKKENLRAPVLHMFMQSGQKALLAVSYPENNNSLENGIRRLKFPSDAPSRSTLKLEEAFLEFIPRDEWDTRLASGMRAVDLGACPGGWTYQLVKRSMMVVSIDNGAMAESLMMTGQVKHYMVDGFKYKPEKKNVYWLVCDMIEKPQRVGQLICDWLINGWCQESIFNLKLPMKKRYETVQEVLAEMQQRFDEAGIKVKFQARHLFHDREEVTVHLCKA